MKTLICTVLLAFAGSALAQEIPFPDFNLEIEGQKAAIRKDASVRKYAKKLGATKIKVVQLASVREPILYTVRTNNACKFNVEVIYADNYLDGILDVVVVRNSTYCK